MNKKQINEMSTRNALIVPRVVTDFVVWAKNSGVFFFFFFPLKGLRERPTVKLSHFPSSIFIARIDKNLGNNSELIIQYMSRPTPTFSFSHLFFPSL